MTFGEKITDLRKKRGITQEQLAGEMGVTRQTISKWELNQSTPDLNYISQLSDLFEVTTDYLIKEDADETDKVSGEENIINNNFTNTQIGSTITKQLIAGIILCIIGSALFLVSVVVNMVFGYLGLGIAGGVLSFIFGIELIFVKKHPVLIIFWTICVILLPIWIIFLIRVFSAPIGFGLVNVGTVFSMLFTIYLIVLIIASVHICRKKR